MNVFVQFSDDNEVKVVSYFSCQQDPVIFPNQGVIDDADPRYLAFVNPSLTVDGKQKALEFFIQQRLDAFAVSVNFDSLLHACMTGLQPAGTYRQSDGAVFIKLRYETWQKAAEIRDAFLAGLRPEPTWDEIEAELPNYPIE